MVHEKLFHLSSMPFNDYLLTVRCASSVAVSLVVGEHSTYLERIFTDFQGIDRAIFTPYSTAHR